MTSQHLLGVLAARRAAIVNGSFYFLFISSLSPSRYKRLVHPLFLFVILGQEMPWIRSQTAG